MTGKPYRPFCRYHCRSCECHFSSLEGFDAHRSGPYEEKRKCDFPELRKGYKWLERDGKCNISSDVAVAPVTIYTLMKPGDYLPGTRTPTARRVRAEK